MLCLPRGKVDDYVKHIVTEHNQEVDHLAKLGTEEQRKVTIENGRQFRKVESSSRVLGWQHKYRVTKCMRCCDQRCGPGQVERNM